MIPTALNPLDTLRQILCIILSPQSEHPCIDVDPRSAHLRGSEEELKNYKVLGLIDSVLLVLDSISYQTFIIKVRLRVVPWHELCFA